MLSGYYKRVGDRLPELILDHDVDLQYLGVCTVNPSNDLITVPAQDYIIGGEFVKFISTGILPSPLSPDTFYHVIDDGLTATTLKVSLTEGGSSVDITDTGTGTHFIITRHFLLLNEQSGVTYADPGTDYLSLNPPRIHFLAPPNRVRFITFGTIPSPLVAGTDYWITDDGSLTDVSFKVSHDGSLNPPIDITSTGSGCQISVIGSRVAEVLNNLQPLGYFSDESYYYPCGVGLFGCAGGGPGAMGGGQQPIEIDKPPKIFFQSKDITDSVRRARDASSMIENLKIVGKNVSGNPKDGFMIN